jgi:hypothetical protein
MEKKICIEERRDKGRGYGRRDRRVSMQRDVLKTECTLF